MSGWKREAGPCGDLESLTQNYAHRTNSAHVEGDCRGHQRAGNWEGENLGQEMEEGPPREFT